MVDPIRGLYSHKEAARYEKQRTLYEKVLCRKKREKGH